MQNVQNAAEIQQRVINLVELYRTKVGKESQVAKDAKEDYEFCEQDATLITSKILKNTSYVTVLTYGNLLCKTQQDLENYQIYNITSINNNNFGNNQHIHLGGK